MKLHKSTASVFVPDGAALPQALERVTHLGIGAHQDDLEFMALDGIARCFESRALWFGGVTCTDGGGSSRTGPFAAFSDGQMRETRREEQNAAAKAGRYGVMIQLDHPSSAVKRAGGCVLRDDLFEILSATAPEVVYTHNLADKHPTHVAVAVAAIAAMRKMPPATRPRQVLGCEVWRGLDWMLDGEKIIHDLSAHEALAHALNAVFVSQIAGGKRYDDAVMGRLRANATFHQSHATDAATLMAFSMDLTPLVRDDTLDIAAYVDGFIERFRDDVRAKLNAQLGT